MIQYYTATQLELSYEFSQTPHKFCIFKIRLLIQYFKKPGLKSVIQRIFKQYKRTGHNNNIHGLGISMTAVSKSQRKHVTLVRAPIWDNNWQKGQLAIHKSHPKDTHN